MGGKKKFALLLSLLLLLSLTLAACGTPAAEQANDLPAEETVAISGNSEAEPEEETEMQIQITAGGQIFTAVLEDNPTTEALLERLPLTIEMTELNGNEKYYYFDEGLPTDPSSVGKIHEGDLMLYGSDCLVLFYKDHGSSYTYTRLGAVEDPEGLAQAVGSGNVTVTWKKRGE